MLERKAAWSVSVREQAVYTGDCQLGVVNDMAKNPPCETAPVRRIDKLKNVIIRTRNGRMV